MTAHHCTYEPEQGLTDEFSTDSGHVCAHAFLWMKWERSICSKPVG